MSKYVVRYGSMRRLGVFAPKGDESYQRSRRVIVRTDRGLEMGDILCESTAQTAKHLKDSVRGHLLRSMTSQDENELTRLRGQEKKEFAVCKEQVEKLELKMSLVDVEHIFGGERVIVYYLAESRVDFRELVKALASEFQTRIEMRQIGVRDEAKLLADYGDCGKPVCCNTHLSEMPPVSMKMAKLQKATLDPTKISGRCGRLKCCLRYEYDTYLELRKTLPPLGADIVTNQGRAKVLAHEILANQVLVETEDRRRLLIDAKDVLTVISKNRQSQQETKQTSRPQFKQPEKEVKASDSDEDKPNESGGVKEERSEGRDD